MNSQPTPFYFSTLPSRARFRRQHFTSAHQLVTPHSAYLWWTQGQQKLQTHHHHFSGKAKYPFQKNQSQPPIPGSWRCQEVQALATTQQHFTKGQQRHGTHFQKQLFHAPLGTNYSCSAGWWFWTSAHYTGYFMVLFLWTSLPLPASEKAICHVLSGMFWKRPI